LIVTLGTVYCHRESLRETTHSILLQHYFFETLTKDKAIKFSSNASIAKLLFCL
jgi:hypothetical protein